MELLFVVLLAAGIGAVVRYAIPGRQSHGMLLLPAIAAVVGAIVWVILTWVGMAWDGGWIWVISLVLSGIAAIIAAIVLPKQRAAADDRLFAEIASRRA